MTTKREKEKKTAKTAPAEPIVEDGEDAGNAELEMRLENAWTALEDGDVEEARSVANEMAAAHPGDAEPHLLLAAAARAEGDTEAALRSLKTANKLEPDWAPPVLWLAELYAEDPEQRGLALKMSLQALDLADEEEEFVDAVLLRTELLLDEGENEKAAELLGELPPDDVTEYPPDIALEIANLYMAVGNAKEAKIRLERLVKQVPDLAEVWHSLGHANEMLGDSKEQARAFLEVLDLDKKDEDEARLTKEDIDEEVATALALLPSRARALLANVPIIVADLPAKKDVAEGFDPRALGLFSGTPLPEQSNMLGAAPELTQIVIFRRNLERFADDEETLRDELRMTLLHETGHFFGLDDDALEAQGLA